MTLLWHVCVTEPRAELDAAEAIREVGYDTLVPIEKRWNTHRGIRKAVEWPLFPGYVLAGVDHQTQPWAALLNRRYGILGILGKPDHGSDRPPAYVPTIWIDAMRKAQECGVFDRTKPGPDKFKIGEVVRVSDGPFAGHQAEIVGFIAKMKSATAKKRVKLMLAFMGQMSKIEVDVTSLEKT